MVPCPWARDAAAMYRGEDVGVHLTLNVRVGAPTAGARSPIRRASSTATAASRAPSARRLGPRRPRRGAQGMPGPDRARDLLGLRRLPPRQPHGHDAAAGRLLRRLPRDWPSTSACRCAWRRRERRAPDRVPVPPRSPSEEGVVFPDHFVYTQRRLARAIERTLFDLAAGRHRDLRASRGRHRRAPRVASRLGARGSRTTRTSTRDASLRDLVGAIGRRSSSATASCASCNARAPAPA